MAAARKISFAAEIGRQTKCLLNFFLFGRAVKPISEAAKAELPPPRSPKNRTKFGAAVVAGRLRTKEGRSPVYNACKNPYSSSGVGTR